jgi:hypothetical protein
MCTVTKSFYTNFLAYEAIDDSVSSPISDINSKPKTMSNEVAIAKFIYNISTGNKQEYLNNCFIDIKTLLEKNCHNYNL